MCCEEMPEFCRWPRCQHEQTTPFLEQWKKDAAALRDRLTEKSSETQRGGEMSDLGVSDDWKADWRKAWAANGYKHRAEELRRDAQLARKRFKGGIWLAPSLAYADALDEAAKLFEQKLAELG